jgi:hypothetical protein
MGVPLGSLDLPDQPDEWRPAEQADVGDSDRPAPKPRELPDPDERGRAYEAARAAVSGEMAGEDSPDRRPDSDGQRSYRDEVPRLLEMRDDLERKWPARERVPIDSSADPPGSADAIAQVAEAEPPFSADTQAIEQENKQRYGGWLEGLEHRLKGEDRLKEKIAAMVKVESDMTAEEALREIPDAIRYTFCFQPENYTRGYYDIKERYESRGYEMYYSQNHWNDAEYKGINTRWAKAEGQRFEVQFHTPDSFHAKNEVTHAVYERIRDPSTSRAESRELHGFQRQVCELIEIPDGAADIADYRKEGF